MGWLSSTCSAMRYLKDPMEQWAEDRQTPYTACAANPDAEPQTPARIAPAQSRARDTKQPGPRRMYRPPSLPPEAERVSGHRHDMCRRSSREGLCHRATRALGLWRQAYCSDGNTVSLESRCSTAGHLLSHVTLRRFWSALVSPAQARLNFGSRPAHPK